MGRPLKQEVGDHWWFDTLSLYHRVKTQMEMRGLSLRVAAEEIGIDFTTIAKLQSREPSVQTVARLCEWLQLPLDTFVRRDVPNYSHTVRGRG